MSKLATYRISYLVTEAHYVDVEASSPKQAEAWLRAMLEEGPLAVHGSVTVGSEHSITGMAEQAGIQ